MGAFYDCINLKSIALPEGIKRIGWGMFYNSGIENIKLPESLTEMGEKVFSGCKSLESVQLPDKISKIETYAFEECTSLASVILPESLAEISERAFSRCSGLTYVKCGENLTDIRAAAFMGCGNLAKVDLPEGLTDIGMSAFSGCNSLADIILPQSLKGIGDGAFSDCSSLKDIDLPKDLTTYSENINAGTAYAEVIGIGDYKGIISKEFTIHKAGQTVKASIETGDFCIGHKKKITANGIGTLQYESDKEEVAVVDNDGVVSGVGVGTAEITIKVPASDNYKAASKKITVTVNPAGVKLTSAKSKAAGKLTVKWKKNAKATGYEIQYSTGKKFAKSATKTKKVKKVSKTSETISKLKKGKNYYVRIRAYKTIANKAYYSGWSSKKKLKIEK